MQTTIRKKKKYGQHFLRNIHVIHEIIDAVSLTKNSSVFEIGPGDGFLTREILKQDIARLWIFEIDEEWAEYLQETIAEEKLTIFQENFLDIDFAPFEQFKPWTLLANLPFQVTFPILHLLHKHRHLLKEGVIMVQEEVAQKILKTSGRGYGFISLFFQYYFEWKKLSKIPPTDFDPPPKVFSRLLYFKPKKEVPKIPNKQEFWAFIKICFKQPRRTLRNNLAQAHYDLAKIPEKYLILRAQQLNITDLMHIWDLVLQG